MDNKFIGEMIDITTPVIITCTKFKKHYMV